MIENWLIQIQLRLCTFGAKLHYTALIQEVHDTWTSKHDTWTSTNIDRFKQEPFEVESIKSTSSEILSVPVCIYKYTIL